MQDVVTISTQKPSDTALDYAALRSAGIRHIEKTASKIWTDYNVHDPGITSLEILCYAITDLSFRCGYRIPDLMRQAGDKPSDIISEFLTARQIFPNKALTINDYRKLIIGGDTLAGEEKKWTGIKNAWLFKKTSSVFADLKRKELTSTDPGHEKKKTVSIKGYYEVLLEFDTSVKTGEEKKQKVAEVKRLLQRNRNLDEDFLRIRTVDQQAFRLCSELEIDPSVDSLEVLADIFFNIQLHLSPSIRFYTLQEMLEDAAVSRTTDTIFEGPFLQNGFIKEEELTASGLKPEIYLSDLMRVILGTPGVTGIPDILFNDISQTRPLENKWVIPVKNNHQAVVDILTSNIVLYKNGVPFRPGLTEKQVVLNGFNERVKKHLDRIRKAKSEDLRFDTGQFRDTAASFSIQHHYPKTYGISTWGLPEDATTERKKQTRQFQGYLWLFDQLLCNYLAQLASVRNIFSVQEQSHTYFTRLARDFHQPEKLFAKYAQVLDMSGQVLEEESWKNCHAPIQDAVEKGLEAPGAPVTEEDPLYYNRRNTFLDHLLSRFAESFYEYVGILHTLFPYTRQREVLELKQAFLQNYPEYSGRRAQAADYTINEEVWDTQAVSGYEKRVKSLLGIKDISRRSLVNIYYVIREELNGSVRQFWFEIIDNRSGNVLLAQHERVDVAVLPPADLARQQTEEQLALEKVKEEVQVAYALCGSGESLKVIKDTDNKFLLELRDKTNALVATGTKGTKRSSEEKKSILENGMQAMSEEGLFLVEHLLLFDPETPVFLPICVNGDCEECADTDPYSFRISMVLPAYAPRFLNMDFRRYTERVLREELPAHLMPKICWVDNEDLKKFEEAWKNWLGVKAGAKDDPDGAIQKNLIDVLTHIKTVYPETCLSECDGTMDKQLFVLDTNSLGTLKN